MSRLLDRFPGHISVSTLPERMLLESGGWREAREIAIRVAESSVVTGAAAIGALAGARLGGSAEGRVDDADLAEARAWEWLRMGVPGRAIQDIAAAFESGATPADPFSRGRLELLHSFALRADGDIEAARSLAVRQLVEDRVRGAFWRSLAADLAKP